MFPGAPQQPGVPGQAPTAQQLQQQHLQRLLAAGMPMVPGAGLTFPPGFQQSQAAQLQLQAQFAQQLQQQALLAQRASLGQPALAFPGGAAGSAKAPAAKGPTGAAPATGKAAAAAKAAQSAAAAAAVRQAETAPVRRAGSGGTIGRKRKAAEARLDKVDQPIPESSLFGAMQDAERRADMLLSRKTMELQEMYASFRRGTPQASGAIRKKLRIYIFNEHFHQDGAGGSGGAGGSAEPPSWALHIQGRLVDAGEPAGALPGPVPIPARQQFTHYVRRLQVQLDPAQYPGGEGRVSWEKSRHDREHRDSFEIRRRGGAPVQATISLELDYQPQQFSLSPPLSSMLGLSGLHSLPYILQLLWGYIKQHGLYQAGQAPLVVRCDEKMKAAFGGAEAIPLIEVQEAVRRSCKPPEPATIQYTVRVDGPSPCHPDCYDFDFEVPLGHELPGFTAKAAVDQELSKVEGELTGILQRLYEHRRRRTYFMGFAQNPVDFINAMVASQARELRVAASKEGESLEVLAAGDVFKEKWVEDAVMRYLQRRAAMGQPVH